MYGSYVVVFTVESTVMIEVGAQGEVEFAIGEYGYIGSANGQGGIESRVGRHLKTASGETENLFWHIDYVLDAAEISVTSVFYSQDIGECDVFECISNKQSRPFASLGASDCSCESHIVRGDVTGTCLKSGLSRFEE